MELVINGVTVDMDAGSFSLEDVLEERSVVDVVVQDPTMTLSFEEGMPWALYDPDRATGTLRFGGLIASSKEKVAEGTGGPGGTPYKRHSLTLHDNTDIAQKRTVAEAYSNATCGDMVADLVEKYLRDEGIITRRAYRREQNQTDWNAAGSVLTNVVAGSDGTLTLAKQGTDWAHTDSLAADWQAGTCAEGAAVTGNVLGLLSWDYDGSYLFPSGDLFGAFTPGQTLYNTQEYQLATNSGGDAKVRLSTVGVLRDFEAWVDTKVQATGTLHDVGIVFRTTYWANPNDTAAYYAGFNGANVVLGHGSNAATGAWTVLRSVAETHSVNVWVHLHLRVQGNHIQVWTGASQASETLVIDYTDTTGAGGGAWQPNAGYVGLRTFNGTGSRQIGYFDNFHVRSLWGTWDTPNDSLASAVRAGTSSVSWAATTPGASGVTVRTSLDGGSSYQPYTAGQGDITNLAHNTDLAGKTLRTRIELVAENDATTPSVTRLTRTVTSGYYPSGTRVCPALDLAPAEVGGSATLDWTPVLPGPFPGTTTITAQTSLDGGATWTSAPAGTSIPGLVLEPDPTIDPFDADTSAGYTQSGDTTHTTWTWDVDASCLRARTDGSTAEYNSFLLRTDLGAYADADVLADFTEADCAFVVARSTLDGATQYALRVCDDSGTYPDRNLSLVRRVNGANTELATADIPWARGTYHRVRLVVKGRNPPTLEASLDGQQLISVTDTASTAITAPGYVGLRNRAIAGNPAAIATVQTAIFVPHGTDLTAAPASAPSPLDSGAFVASVDLMKVTQDRDGGASPFTPEQIAQAVGVVAGLGGTHATVDIHYDYPEQMAQWAAAIRAAGLHVWWRPRWNHWAGHNGAPADMPPAQYISATTAFIAAHPVLFAPGDVFDPCMEASDGTPYWATTYGPNWHWQNAPNAGTNAFNQFLLDLHSGCRTALAAAGCVGVEARVQSLNGWWCYSPSSLYPSTVAALGNAVTTDSYPGAWTTSSDPTTATSALMAEYDQIHAAYPAAKVVLGEVGYAAGFVPDDATQEAVLRTMLTAIASRPWIVGMNYWCGPGGWSGDGTAIFANFTPGTYTRRPAADTLAAEYARRAAAAAAQSGTAPAGAALLVRHTLATTDASFTPALLNATASVRSVYIQSGPLVGTALFPYIKADKALDSLAEAADFWWYVDEQFRAHFRGRKVWPAPFALTGALMLDGTVEVTRGNPNYRNRQFIIGSTGMTDRQVEEYHGNGEARQFMIAFPLAKKPEKLLINGVAQTLGIKGVDKTDPPTKQWYWSTSDAANVLVQEEKAPDGMGGLTDVPFLTRDDTFHIEYYGAFEQVVVAEDTAEVYRRQALEQRGTGYVDDVYSAPQATTKDAAFAIANSKLARYGVPGRILTFQTDVAGLKPGMMATVWLPEHGFHGEQLLIESVTWDEVGFDAAGATNTNHGVPGPWLRYSVKAVSGPVDGTWTKVFADLSAQAPAYVEALNAGQNVALATAHSEADPWAWTEDAPTPTVFACPVPADTLYPSSTLYPC